jgi:hypothetical protein
MPVTPCACALSIFDTMAPPSHTYTLPSSCPVRTWPEGRNVTHSTCCVVPTFPKRPFAPSRVSPFQNFVCLLPTDTNSLPGE